MKFEGMAQTIMLDRYARKSSKTIAIGMTALFRDESSWNKIVGKISGINGRRVEVTFDGASGPESRWMLIESVDIPVENEWSDIAHRVSSVLAEVEDADDRALIEETFFDAINEGRLVPGGRVLYSAGQEGLTLSNCFVIPHPKDSRGGIFDTLTTMAEIMSRGGGVGINISSLRPKNAPVRGVNGRSSGAVSWGGLYSYTTGLIEQGGSRRGALMLQLDDWHPDLIDFINSKRTAGKITNANISVNISAQFMWAVEDDARWMFKFPDTSHVAYDSEWTGNIEEWESAGYPVIEYESLPARDIWKLITDSAWASAEPGIVFVDNVHEEANSSYMYKMLCTNPCGELPLPPFGVCNLASINLAKHYKDGDVDYPMLAQTIDAGVRLLDNVIEATPYFLEENERVQKHERRSGLNTMGLAELMILLGIRYGSEESLAFIDKLYSFIRDTAYEASIELAVQRGPFPGYSNKFLDSGFARRLPEHIRADIEANGIRNVTILTQAPNGTIGTMCGTSTGVEPFFQFEYIRKSRLGTFREEIGIARKWREENPGEPLPDYFVTAMDLTPEEHMAVQARIQRYIDSSISKTTNMPRGTTPEDVARLYESAYSLGCKSVTVYVDGSRDEQILMRVEDVHEAAKNLSVALDNAPDATCPECGSELAEQDGCSTCLSCGYSACQL